MIIINILLLLFPISLNIQFSLSPLESINSKNSFLRKLLTKTLTSNDYNFFIMKTEVCLGTPKQCFNVIYDTGNPYLILGLDKTLSKFNKAFNTKHSSTYTSGSTSLFYAIPYKHDLIYSVEGKDIIYLSEKQDPKFLFSFLHSFNTSDSYDYDGILGLGNHYPKHDNDNALDDRFSLVHYLKKAGLINKRIFGHGYNDRRGGVLFLGEEPTTMTDGYFKCKVEPFITLFNKWYCQCSKIYGGENTHFFHHKRIIVFDTGYKYIRAYYPDAIEIFKTFVEISENECYIDEALNEEGEAKYANLFCDIDIDLDNFYDIHFDFFGNKMTLLKRDLFRKVYKEEDLIYELNILADNTMRELHWNLGQVVLKNYDMVFNYDDNTVGFKQNLNYQGGDWTSIGILLLILILLIVGTVFLFINRKKFLSKKIKDSDLEMLNNKGNKQMQELL